MRCDKRTSIEVEYGISSPTVHYTIVIDSHRPIRLQTHAAHGTGHRPTGGNCVI